MNKKRHLLRSASLSLLFTITVVASVAGAMIYHGVAITSFSVGGVRVEQLSLRWQRKLELEVDRVILTATAGKADSSEQAPASLSPNAVRRLLDAIKLVERLFATIDIHEIHAAGLQARFSYREDASGQLLVTGASAEVDLGIHFDDDMLLLDVRQLELPGVGVSAEGWVQIEPEERQLQADLAVLLADTLPLSIQVEADRQQLTFSGHGDAAVKDICVNCIFVQLVAKNYSVVDGLFARARHFARDVSRYHPLSRPW